MSEMTTPTITLGTRLALARKAAGIHAKDIASALRVTTTTISRYENDSTPVPMAVLYAYQDICRVPMEWLRGEMALTQETVASRCIDEWPCQGTLFALAA